MKKYFLYTLMVLLAGCQGAKTEDKTEAAVIAKPTYNHPVSINKVFDAHGGYENWSKMKQLSYDMPNGQHHLIELQNRYTRISSETQTVGYNGNEVWVMPPSENAARARMTYNLYFYFYAFPFVVGDPGITYEDMPPMEILGKTYNGVKVSYGDGVGDSPKDNYIIYSDPETNKMAWLMYTATFGAQETSDRFNLIKYNEWQDLNGVFLPKTLQWYQFKDNVVGDMRNELVFENVTLSTEMPAMQNFEMPEGAQIVSGQQESEN